MSDQTPDDDTGPIDISDVPGWRYLPFEANGDSLTITVVRDDDGREARFTVPTIVQRGAELGEIAKIVIAAQERDDRAGGAGG
jgi:hypothetical protein